MNKKQLSLVAGIAGLVFSKHLTVIATVQMENIDNADTILWGIRAFSAFLIYKGVK